MNFRRTAAVLALTTSLLATAEKGDLRDRPTPPPDEKAARDPAFVYLQKKNSLASFADEGMRRYAQGDCTGAQNSLEAAKLFEPEKLTAWSQNLLYHAMMSCGQYDKAQAVAEEIVRNAPLESLPFLQLGIAELWNKKPKPALENFKRALEFDSHSPRTHFYKGIAHGYLGDAKAREKEFLEAVKEYRTILTRNPKDFTANYELAALYLYWPTELSEASKRVAAAKESLTGSAPPPDELSEEKKWMTQFHMPLLEGILYSRLGEHDDAVDKLKEALLKAPSGARADVAELYFYLGKSLQAQQEKEKAKGAFAKSGELDPNGPFSQEAKRGLAAVGKP